MKHGETSFEHYLQQCQQRINAALPQQLQQRNSEFADGTELGPLYEAMLYGLTNGGKRVRPMLVYAAAEACGNADSNLLDQVASAVECIHAYSLIHDDLPAMDDDDLRRGKPTCHIAFDEATAILAGDGLQALAFELLSHCNASAEQRLAMIQQLSAASGPRGMVGGQAIDLAAVNTQLDLAQLQGMHQLKTGALIRAALGLGAIAAGASDDQQQALDSYGLAIGLAFQVQDDILDIESSTEELGKTQGADQALNKPTYPALLGLDRAKAMAQSLAYEATAALKQAGLETEALLGLARYIVERRH